MPAPLAVERDSMQGAVNNCKILFDVRAKVRYLSGMQTNPSDYDKSTGEGQKRLFYEVQQNAGETVQEKMARMSYNAGYADAESGKEVRLKNNTDYMRGFRDGAPLSQWECYPESR